MAYQLLTPSDGDLARCGGVQFAEFKNGTQILLVFKIHGDGPNQGRVITYFGSFGDNSIDFTVDALRACGWQGDNLADVPAAFDRGELDAEVSLKIVNELVLDAQKRPVLDEHGQEKWRDRVAFVNIPGVGGGGFKPEKPLDGAELANFGARMRTAVANAGRRKPSAKASPATNNGGPRASPPRGAARGSSHAHDDSIPPPSDDDRGW